MNRKLGFAAAVAAYGDDWRVNLFCDHRVAGDFAAADAVFRSGSKLSRDDLDFYRMKRALAAKGLPRLDELGVLV